MILSLETTRLTLSPIEVEDAREMAVVLASPSLYVFTGGMSETAEELAVRYRRWVAGPSKPGQRWLNLLVRARESGLAVGYVQATVNGNEAEIAWVIGAEWHGRGYATEAAAALMAHLDGVERFVAFIMPGHVASQRVADKLGMVMTGAVVKGENEWALERRARGTVC